MPLRTCSSLRTVYRAKIESSRDAGSGEDSCTMGRGPGARQLHDYAILDAYNRRRKEIERNPTYSSSGGQIYLTIYDNERKIACGGSIGSHDFNLATVASSLDRDTTKPQPDSNTSDSDTRGRYRGGGG